MSFSCPPSWEPMHWPHPRHSPLFSQDNTRISSAGCLGELCAFLTEEELNTVLQQCLLGRSLHRPGGEAWDTCFLPLEGSWGPGLPLSLGDQLLKQTGVSVAPVATSQEQLRELP